MDDLRQPIIDLAHIDAITQMHLLRSHEWNRERRATQKKGARNRAPSSPQSGNL